MMRAAAGGPSDRRHDVSSGRHIDRYAMLVNAFGGKRVLVLGDMVADEYIVGRPARISREAPVLVLHHARDFVRPGGAANVAFNLSALGAKTCVAGVVGHDEQGARLRSALQDVGVDDGGLIVVPDRPTSTKTRVVAGGTQEMQQQIVRIDRVDLTDVDGDSCRRLVDVAERIIRYVDAIVISDYENGVINAAVIAAVLPLARGLGRVIAVDSHGDLFRFQGVTVATPNQPEAEATLGRHISTVTELEDAGRRLQVGMKAQGVLLTRGSEGMSLFEQDRPPQHFPPANVVEVRDPTGAGDTACAVFTLALLAGATMSEAAVLSGFAAGEVVKRLGAAAISPEELIAAVRRHGHRSS